MVEHPAGCAATSPANGRCAAAFQCRVTLGIRDSWNFVAASPWLTRSRAYASPTSLPPSAQGSLPARRAKALTGRDSHPLDDSSEFQKGFATSYPLKLAVLGRTTTFQMTFALVIGVKSKDLPLIFSKRS